MRVSIVNGRNNGEKMHCRGETTLKLFGWLWLKAGSGPDSAEATENTEWVRTEFTENYDFPIPGFSSVTG